MNAGAERSVSLWMATGRAIAAPRLEHDESADVAVVGGGIAGLSAAYELARAGQSVVLVDRGPIGRGMTARTTAHLTCELDDFYHEHIRMRSEAEARAYYESQAAAIDRAEEIQQREGIACDFRRLDGYLFLAPGDDPALLEREFQACHRIGFADVGWVERAPLARGTGRCLRFPRQGRFHPLRYLEGLARCARRDGARLYADTPVVGVEEKNGVTLRTEAGPRVTARACIVATNTPVNDWIALHTKQAPYRTYAMAARLPRGALEDALYWDTLDAYHYIRLQPGEGDEDWVIVGGEDHKSGEAQDAGLRFARLEAWMREHVPRAGEVVHRWSGQVMEPVDYAPFVGRNPGNEQVFIVTGDSGDGITTGVMAGMLLRDLVLGRENPWAAAYAPHRVTLGAAGEYLRENATMVANLTEHVTGGQTTTAETLAPGQGAVVRMGGQKVAAYRDAAGALHLRSAVCTHARCILRWNAFETCWDCPCHGSQFSVDGEPLNGPAIHPLPEVKASS